MMNPGSAKNPNACAMCGKQAHNTERLLVGPTGTGCAVVRCFPVYCQLALINGTPHTADMSIPTRGSNVGAMWKQCGSNVEVMQP